MDEKREKPSIFVFKIKRAKSFIENNRLHNFKGQNILLLVYLQGAKVQNLLVVQLVACL